MVYESVFFFLYTLIGLSCLFTFYITTMLIDLFNSKNWINKSFFSHLKFLLNIYIFNFYKYYKYM